MFGNWELKHYLEKKYIEIRNNRPVTESEKKSNPYWNRITTIGNGGQVLITVTKNKVKYGQNNTMEWTMKEWESYIKKFNSVIGKMQIKICNKPYDEKKSKAELERQKNIIINPI